MRATTPGALRSPDGRVMPSLSRTVFESASIEDVFLRRQLQQLTIAADKARPPTAPEGSPARGLAPLGSSVSLGTLRSLRSKGAHGHGSISRPATQQRARAPPSDARSPASTLGWGGGSLDGTRRSLEWTGGSWREPSASPSEPPPTPYALAAGGGAAAAAALALERAPTPEPARAARDAATIADLRQLVDALRGRMEGMEAMLRHVNVEYALRTQTQLQDSFAQIHARVASLDGTLQTELERKRLRAATMLGARVRGFVARARFRKALGAMRAWHARALHSTSNLIIACLLRQRRLRAGVAELIEARKTALLRRVARAWRGYTRGQLPARAELADWIHARRHYQWALARRVFGGWRGAARAARAAGARYVVRANRRVAIADEEMRFVGAHVRGWRAYTARVHEAERRFVSGRYALLRWTLSALRGFVGRARALRLLSLERWIGEIRRYSELPFRAWQLHTLDRKIKRRAADALASMFRRRSSRALLGRLMGGWFEFAVHRRVEVRSRAQLIRALKEQEEASAMLEANVKECVRARCRARRCSRARAHTPRDGAGELRRVALAQSRERETERERERERESERVLVCARPP
jgi:hypothetical protein